MKKNVLLSVCGRQKYMDQEPDTIELVTEGTMEFRDNGWDICYNESELTGLAGVTTNFRIESDKIVLTRTGKLNSQMVFQPGIKHDSLYQMEFGALMITVCANRIIANLDDLNISFTVFPGIMISKSSIAQLVRWIIIWIYV